MIRSDSSKAYVVSGAGANGVWIKVWEEFQGRKLVALTNGAARLEQTGRSINLLLYLEQ